MEVDRTVDLSNAKETVIKQQAMMKELVEGNDEISKKYELLQKEKNQKLKEYRGVILQMKKEKRSDNTNVDALLRIFLK